VGCGLCGEEKTGAVLNFLLLGCLGLGLVRSGVCDPFMS